MKNLHCWRSQSMLHFLRKAAPIQPRLSHSKSRATCWPSSGEWVLSGQLGVQGKQNRAPTPTASGARSRPPAAAAGSFQCKPACGEWCTSRKFSLPPPRPAGSGRSTPGRTPRPVASGRWPSLSGRVRRRLVRATTSGRTMYAVPVRRPSLSRALSA